MVIDVLSSKFRFVTTDQLVTIHNRVARFTESQTCVIPFNIERLLYVGGKYLATFVLILYLLSSNPCVI